MKSGTMKGLLHCAIYYCLIAFVASQGTFTCDPATDCGTNSTTAGSSVPDPNDCERFYVCISVGGQLVPSTSSIKCPDGQYFDQVEKTCSNETTPGTCGPNICPFSVCETECPNPYTNITYVADKSSCNSYYICLQTGPLKVTCPTNTPYYDGFTCVADESKCCDFCTAYCETAGSQIVDPCDCTSYYICIEGSVPASENYKFTCASGTFYDEATATCKSGSCSNICSSCGTENSIASTPTTAQPPIETTPTTPTTTATTPTTATASTTTAATPTTVTGTTPTTATTSTTTTASSASTPTTPFGGCTSLESFTCPSNGNFQMCPYCFKYFFHCSGGTATIVECSGNTVYNPNAQFPYCLDPANCPYP